MEQGLVDVFVQDGKIIEIAPTGQKSPVGRLYDADGGFISPPFADPHLHLDAALLCLSAPNHSGTLKEGIENWSRCRSEMSEVDLIERASTALKWCVSNGVTRIRTHVDTSSKMAVETLVAFRDEVSHLAELQVVAFPQEGVMGTTAHQEALAWAAAAGVDCVGAIPHHERTVSEGDDSIRLAFDLAEKHALQVDLHCDETDNPDSRHIFTVCRERLKRDFGSHVTAGHCTAMHSYPEDIAKHAIDEIVESGVQVIANPLDNIVLQGRQDHYPKRRGITRVPELIEAGAMVGVGHDSILDPWYPLGMGRILDAASMLVHVTQMTRPDQIQRVFQLLVDDNHIGFGGAPDVSVGSRADFLIHSVSDVSTLMRTKSAPRWVVHRGVVVAETHPVNSFVLDEAIRPGVLPE